MSNTDTQKTSDASNAANGRVGSGDSSASDTPRTNDAVNAGGHQLLNVAECSRALERELFAFKRSNERIIHDYNMLARDTRYAEAMQRAAERETAALAERVKLLEEQRNTLNETCHTLRAQIAELSPNKADMPTCSK